MAKIFNPLISFILLAAVAQACAEPVALLAGRDIDVLKAVLGSQCTKTDSTPTAISDLPSAMDVKSMPEAWSASDTYLKELTSRTSEGTRWPLGELCKNTQVVAEIRLAANPAGAGRALPGSSRFAKAFDGARVLKTISRPLFAADGKHAVIATNHMCGPLCGNGAVIELELTKDGWKIIKSAMTWIS
jgi:hypothetical protein